MDWNALGAVGELVGALAVVLTLMYLAKQINQTNRLSRFNGTNQILDRFDQTNRLIVSDAETRRVLLKKGPLTEDESEHLYAFVDVLCNAYAAVESAYQADLLDESVYDGASRDLEISIRRWPNAKDKFELWLDRYPVARGLRIFESLR